MFVCMEYTVLHEPDQDEVFIEEGIKKPLLKKLEILVFDNKSGHF